MGKARGESSASAAAFDRRSMMLLATVAAVSYNFASVPRSGVPRMSTVTSAPTATIREDLS